nr:uncharacterized protein LOC111506164 [Leptinotarsa decemlineata]XP_023016931.1 uncharacterized protein LOC111506164 [Leptinotarsa decemlineata]
MQHRILFQSLLICVITVCLSFPLQKSIDAKSIKDEVYSRVNETELRSKRATKNPGFFRTLFSVIYEQWNDTKNTFGTVNQLINDNFLPENEPVTETTTPNSNPNVTTTEAPYRITRTELNKILRRNLRGLQRLFQIELQDALKQSDQNYIEFRKNASREISKFL